MDRDMRQELQQAIKGYNETQQDMENRVNMHDILSEIGSLENEEVEKAVEILKSKSENREQY